MNECTVEFMIEPFAQDSPGPHVLSGIEAMKTRGFTVSMGPFGSTVTGNVSDISAAIGAMVLAAANDGAQRIFVEVAMEAM